jgi:hypothetical protein
MITISSDDPRSIKAIEIAAGAGQWLKCHTADGEKAYGVPSQCRRKSDVYYVVDAQRCTCVDFQRNGLSYGRLGDNGYHGPCKHVLAVRLHLELARAQQSRPKRRHHLRPVSPLEWGG